MVLDMADLTLMLYVAKVANYAGDVIAYLAVVIAAWSVVQEDWGELGWKHTALAWGTIVAVPVLKYAAAMLVIIPIGLLFEAVNPTPLTESQIKVFAEPILYHTTQVHLVGVSLPMSTYLNLVAWIWLAGVVIRVLREAIEAHFWVVKSAVAFTMRSR